MKQNKKTRFNGFSVITRTTLAGVAAVTAVLLLASAEAWGVCLLNVPEENETRLEMSTAPESTNAIPPIDANQPELVETATFALG